jgi:hypothetical protein
MGGMAGWGAGVGLTTVRVPVPIGYLDAHRPGDPVEGLESAAQA